MRQLNIEKSAFIIVMLLLFAIAIRVPVDTDTWWHLRSADYILNNGTIHGDPFSHTNEGGTWINHSWGAQLIMYGAWQLAGNLGLGLYTGLLAVGGMFLLYQVSAGNNYLRAFILVLGASTAAVFWSARPQMLSFFFTCLTLFLIYRYKKDGEDWLWGIVPMIWAWANVHAGWSIGYLFIFAFLVGEAFNNFLGTESMGWQGWRKLLLVTVVSLPFLVISPYFMDNALVPLRTVNIAPLRAFIQEWQSPNFQGIESYPVIATILLLFLGMWTSRLKFDWSSFFLLAGTLFLALLYSRNIAVFAVASVPILSYLLDNALAEHGYILRTRQKIPTLMAYLNLGMILIIGLGLIFYIAASFLPQNLEEAQAEILPIDAAAYLREHELPREMFNNYNWGGYLMFAAPEYPIFIDGRTDLYGDFLYVYNNMQLANGDWQSELDTYNINLIVIQKNSLLDSALRDESSWELVYEDDLAVIWQRKSNNE